MDAVSTGDATPAEHARTDTEAQLRLALDMAELGTWSFSLTDGSGVLDERAAQIVGLPPGSFSDVLQAQLKATHPDDLAALHSALAAGIDSGRPFDLTYRVVRPDGSVGHVASRAMALSDGTGRAVRVVGTNRDITVHHNAGAERDRLLVETEEALAGADLARRRLEALLEHLPVGVTLAEAPGGRLLVSNAAVARIWGVDTAAGGVSDYSAIYVGFRPGPEPEAERQYASGEWPLARALVLGEVVIDEVIEIAWPDGGRHMVSVSAVPVRDANGMVVGGAVMTQDVHYRESLLASERAARERTERLQALTAALAGTRTVDDVATVVVANMVQSMGAKTGALALLAAEGDALLLFRTVGFPEPVEERLRRQRLDLQSPLTACFRTQAPVWVECREGPSGLDANYPPIAPVWEELGLAAAAFVPLIAAGNAVGVISFAFEHRRVFSAADRAFLSTLGQQAALAVERARLFDAEQVARAEAERANKAKSEFLAVMSHELRTPLQAIDGYAELMELGLHGPLTGEQRHALARIRKSESHLLGLINGVLDYAQLEAGAVQYVFEDVLMEDMLTTCQALIAPQAAIKGIYLHRDPCVAVCARVDREKAQQIVINLLSNAIKFTPSGGEVRVRCARQDDGRGAWAQIDVQDTGIGIPAAHLQRIFEPFVQIDSALTRTHQGTGLGLAISHDLAQGLGGELTAESTPGLGSRFSLRLPLAG